MPINNHLHVAEKVISHTGTMQWLTGHSTIEEAWHCHVLAPEVFKRFDLLNCQHCAVRFDESIEEAAENYDFSLELFLSSLNWLIRQGHLK